MPNTAVRRDKILRNLERKPSSILNISQFAGRFFVGEMEEPTREQYDRFIDMMMEGDPLADGLAEALVDDVPGGLQMLDRALKYGIESVPEAPQALKEVVTESSQAPVWLDEDMILTGQRAIQRSGIWAPFILGDVALLGGYVLMGSMNKTLVATGALGEGGSAKRLLETYQWFLDVTKEGNLDRYSKGFESAVKVRIMHGIVRHSLKDRPTWKTDEWGIPVSQAHMAATLQAFGAAFITAARGLGVHYTDYERASMMHLWRYLGWLGGVKEEYCYTSERDAMRIIYMSARTSPPVDQDAIDLASGYFESEYDFSFLDEVGLGFVGEALTKVSTNTRLGLIRLMLGKEDFEALRLPDAGAWVLAPMAMAGLSHVYGATTNLLPGNKRIGAWLGRQIHEGLLNLVGAEHKHSEATFVPYDQRASVPPNLKLA